MSHTSLRPAEIFQLVREGLDINVCQEMILELNDPMYAFLFAYTFSYAGLKVDIQKCQEVACKSAVYALTFAYHIREANIEACQKAACKIPEYAFLFARKIKGADIEYCWNA